MKILVRLSFLTLIPIIVGLALALSGYGIGVWILAFGTPAVMISLVIAGIIMLVKGKLYKQDEASEGLSEKEKEQADIDKINQSRFYKNRFAIAEYQAKHITEATKQTSKKGFILGISFFFLLVADAICATVLLIKGVWIGAVVCAALFGLTIIVILITVAIRYALTAKGDIRKAKKIIEGKVKSCVASSIFAYKVAFSERVKSIVYRIIVSADGAEYVAFSKQFYETEETVIIAVMGKKHAKIVSEAELKANCIPFRN